MIGQPGCSRFFILGIAIIPIPETAEKSLTALRRRLVQDPYFKDVPSMQLETRKTALAFHAKDDIPEVRKEVFTLLRRYPDIKFLAVIKDKWSVYKYVKSRNFHDGNYRYSPNELYDYLVRRLFKNLLHTHDKYHVTFARRGKSDRTAALYHALEDIRNRFYQENQINAQAPPIQVQAKSSYESAGLQVVDYFLWALQRLYEKRVIQFVNYLRPSFRLVIDIDDERKKKYGEYYDQRKPLTLKALEGRWEIK